MSINGIRDGYSNPASNPNFRDHASVDESVAKSIHAREQSSGDVNAARHSTQSVLAEAPPGTDPALWSVLTSEERSLLASAQPAGPLTYGPSRGVPVSPGGPLGGRIDLRV